MITLVEDLSLFPSLGIIIKLEEEWIILRNSDQGFSKTEMSDVPILDNFSFSDFFGQPSRLNGGKVSFNFSVLTKSVLKVFS